MEGEEERAFDELAKLSINDENGSTQAKATSVDKETVNVVLIGHVGI